MASGNLRRCILGHDSRKGHTQTQLDTLKREFQTKSVHNWRYSTKGITLQSVTRVSRPIENFSWIARENRKGHCQVKMRIVALNSTWPWLTARYNLCSRRGCCPLPLATRWRTFTDATRLVFTVRLTHRRSRRLSFTHARYIRSTR